MSKIVFYHKNCLDGFSCCWLAYLKFKNKAEYIALDPKENFNYKIFKNKEIYFFDLTPYKKDLIFLKKFNKVIIIDHHLSNKNVLKFANKYIYNIKNCASYLAWNYFFPKEKIPVFLKYVQAIDLWQKNKKYFNEILTFLENEKQEFKNWNRLKKMFENKDQFKKIIKEGKVLLKQKEKMINILIKRASVVEFEKYKILAVNSPFFNSEIGDKLISKKYPFVLIWYQTKDEIRVSLRSKKNFDVSKIALKYKGGGHKNASGFSFKINKKFPWKVVA